MHTTSPLTSNVSSSSDVSRILAPYLRKFGQVFFLREKGFCDLDISVTTGLSLYGVKAFSEIYHSLKGTEGFKRRRDELFTQGSEYYASAEKKSSSSVNA